MNEYVYGYSEQASSRARCCGPPSWRVVGCWRYFFFQAEDGIRDHCVTGVQTCALPISSRCDTESSNTNVVMFAHTSSPSSAYVGASSHCASSSALEIGRASCRERG